MARITPNLKKRSYLLPPGCKDLVDLLHGPPAKPVFSGVRVNGKIKAHEIRLISERGRQLGMMPLAQALKLGRERGTDVVEIVPHAKPPVCRLVDYGTFRYEQSRRKKTK